MNKQELLHKVKEANPGMTMKVASAALESILSVIAGALANGEKVTLLDLGLSRCAIASPVKVATLPRGRR